MSSTVTTTETRTTESTTDSSISTTKPVPDTNKTQIQADFRHQIAKLLSEPPDKTTIQSSASNEDPPGAAPTKQHSQKPSEITQPRSTSSASSSRSGSISRPKSPTPGPSTGVSTTASKESTSSKSSELPQPGHPGIRTRNIADDKLDSKSTQDDKRDRSDSQKLQDYEPMESTDNTTNDSKLTVDKYFLFCNLEQTVVNHMGMMTYASEL